MPKAKILCNGSTFVTGEEKSGREGTRGDPNAMGASGRKKRWEEERARRTREGGQEVHKSDFVPQAGFFLPWLRREKLTPSTLTTLEKVLISLLGDQT